MGNQNRTGTMGFEPSSATRRLAPLDWGHFFFSLETCVVELRQSWLRQRVCHLVVGRHICDEDVSPLFCSPQRLRLWCWCVLFSRMVFFSIAKTAWLSQRRIGVGSATLSVSRFWIFFALKPDIKAMSSASAEECETNFCRVLFQCKGAENDPFWGELQNLDANARWRWQMKHQWRFSKESELEVV